MLNIIASLFGCAHYRCTFPMTATDRCSRSGEKSSATTYVVCLDCGEEFKYDWQQMKVIGSVKRSQPIAA